MPPKSNDADDVLDFINSLPDSKSGTPKPTDDGNKDNSEDFLEFLDELAAHDKSKPSTGSPVVNSVLKPSTSKEPKESKESKQPKESKNEVEIKTPIVESSDGGQDVSTPEPEIDPIGSISTWWNKEGSNKVSSLWGSIASNAQQITDTTYQIASTTTNQISQQRQKLLSEHNFNADQITQLDSLGERLNSVFTNMSQQITQGLIGPDDELLNILLVHDLYNVNYLDKECALKFNKVMDQVEGGIRVTVNNFNHKEQENDKVNLNLFHGKIIDGEKLCFANLESSIKDYSSYTLADENAKKEEGIDQTKDTSQTINKSNIFISIQPITSRTSNEETEPKDENSPILIESNNKDSFAFTLILKDITNNITIITKTQPFSLIWAQWLNGESSTDENINPSEWVKDWIKDGLALSFGVLAQEYVVKRMGY
ncbi:maintenance of telomere capping protein 1 [[Candida] anglica]|uniref:Maintenance of telomere capping protein 1 n=1 Tax=[Candida] anglica TaxID=148631 RepID=A0ABP0EJJ1_9ASCO